MKILNLYSGIGGNRKLWGDEHEVTAVEHKPDIAAIYQDFFPKDRVVVADAHQYLLEHYKEFDFIWSSPPCPSHSKARFAFGVHGGKVEAIYPDMTLWQEIILLKHHFDGKYCVENVIAYYKSLIPCMEFAGHRFWTNFPVAPYDAIHNYDRDHDSPMEALQKKKGFDLSNYKLKNKRVILKNCVEPVVARHILDWAITPYQLNRQLAIRHKATQL